MTPYKVLIIDNDTSLSELTGVILSTVGDRVLFAATGEQGLEMIKQERPDWVILNILLPDFNQIQERIEAIQGLKILLLMPKDNQVDGVWIKYKPNRLYLGIPFTPDILFAARQALLDGKDLYASNLNIHFTD